MRIGAVAGGHCQRLFADTGPTGRTEATERRYNGSVYSCICRAAPVLRSAARHGIVLALPSCGPAAAGLYAPLEVLSMEATDVRSAIEDLQARVASIRDWL